MSDLHSFVMEHHCKALVIHCIDFRFRKSLAQFLEARFGDLYDLVSVAGGVKNLISDPPDNNFILEQIKISETLHKPEVILLIQHEDCGAYGGSKSFEGADKEISFQGRELAKAKVLLEEVLPGHKIETYFIRLSGEMVSVPM